MQRTLSGDSLIFTAGSFMACTPDIKLSTRFGGLRGMFSGEGAFFIECSGSGELFFNSFGAIMEKDVEGSLIVDTGNVVAWEPALDYELPRAASIRSFLFSDQILMRFSGQGKLWVQSRTPRTLADWVYPFRRKRQQESNN